MDKANVRLPQPPRISTAQEVYARRLNREIERGFAVHDTSLSALLYRIYEIEAVLGLERYSAAVADSTGDPVADINGYDFTGNPNATGTALNIRQSASVTIIYGVRGFLYAGPRPVTIGQGGSHTLVATDLRLIP